MKPLAPERHDLPGEDVNGLVAFLRGWDRFWFQPADPTTLGFIRIGAGMVILYVHLAYSFGLMDYVGPHAWLDNQTTEWLRNDVAIYGVPAGWFDRVERPIAKGYYIWSIYFSVEDPFWIHVIHTGFLVAMALFTIGLWTRTASVLSWIGVLCYIQRAPTTLFGMDTMMNILMLYLMIGPSGAALSVDRWLKLRRSGWTGGKAPPPQPLMSANFAIRLLQIHFCVIYMASGTSKLLGSAWWNGTAVWGTFANYSFAPMNLSWYSGFLLWLARERWLWELVMTAGCVFTLALEISLPYLIWLPKTRWLMLACAVMLHTGIGITMGLVTFSLMMLLIVFSFVPPQTVHQLLDWLSGATERRLETGTGIPSKTAAELESSVRSL